jgi:hypothetical protein
MIKLNQAMQYEKTTRRKGKAGDFPKYCCNLRKTGKAINYKSKNPGLKAGK